MNEEHDITIPRKSIDQTETIEDRLTGNVLNRIGPARYFNKDENGEVVEDWNDVFDRVATNVAEAEYEFGGGDMKYITWKTAFEDAMREQRFIPNTPTIASAGTELQMLSACFVNSPDDSMDDILESAKEWGLVEKTGGGMGGAFYQLRPKGALVGSTGGTSSGPMPFIEMYDAVGGSIKQGSIRSGAQMAIMHAHHADVGRFCVSKRTEGRLENFNISVAVTDEFIEAVESDEQYTLYEADDLEPRPRSDVQEVLPETKHFYDPEYEDAWNDDTDQPAEGVDGKAVEENLWRDFGNEIAGIDQYRDRIDLEVGEPMELPARFVWQLIVDGAWNNGEPGVYYIDEANREHSFDVEEHPETAQLATNPCFTGETLIYTGNGLKRAEDLYESGEEISVATSSEVSDETMQDASEVFTTGKKEVFKVGTEEGYEVRLTSDHRLYTDNGWTAVEELESGDTVYVQDREGMFGSGGNEDTGRVLGWFAGDGHINSYDDTAYLNFYDRDSELSSEFADSVGNVIRDPKSGSSSISVYEVDGRAPHRQNDESVEQRVGGSRLYDLVEEHNMLERNVVPESVMEGSREQSIGFLQGLFTSDGSIQGNKEKGFRVRLGSTSEEMLQDVQKLLLNFGIQSTIYDGREEGYREMPDGKGGTNEYRCKKMYRLDITSKSLVTFKEKIGFIRSDKRSDLRDAIESYTRGPYKKQFTATIESIEYDGIERVYDLTEPNSNSLVTNGFVSHNCAEQNLCEYEACNLGHVNLSLMVDESAPLFDRFTDQFNRNDEELVEAYLNRALDQELFDETVRVGTRFLDNVVTQSEFPIEQIQEQVYAKRKIGLGLMGFAQMLVQMGIPYGSDVSYEIARGIMRRIDEQSTRVSHELAEERGPFPDYEKSKWSDPTSYPEWFEEHAHEDPHRYDDGYLVRNHSQTTIAPTGTTSRVGDTTGGCEPIYNTVFFKNVSQDIQGDDMLVVFDDYLERVLEANGIDAQGVKDEAVRLMMDDEFDSIGDVEQVPDEIDELFTTTEDLSEKQHVDMQAAFQEHCSSGISKTVNAPVDATRDDISDALLRGLKNGVKGTTVYRQGSRQEQVNTTSVTNKQFSDEEKERLVEDVEAFVSTVDDGAEIIEAAINTNGGEN